MILNSSDSSSIQNETKEKEEEHEGLIMQENIENVDNNESNVNNDIKVGNNNINNISYINKARNIIKKVRTSRVSS